MFDTLFKFEEDLARYTGAPYAIVTDCCTHAIELCMRYELILECQLTPYTYLSVPMVLERLGIDYKFLDHEKQQWSDEYQFIGTRIWDSARRLQPGMYKSGQMQCLSFGHTKPLQLGRGGAILLDDPDAYAVISRQRSDGRDLRISPWINQEVFDIGWHYCPTLESCAKGSEMLLEYQPVLQQVMYPDLRKIVIKN